MVGGSDLRLRNGGVLHLLPETSLGKNNSIDSKMISTHFSSPVSSFSVISDTYVREDPKYV